MIFPGTENADATADKFFATEVLDSSPWSIHSQKTAAGGVPVYDIMVSNKSALEADMVAYSSGMTGVALTAYVSDLQFAFRWIGIKYHAGGTSSGNYTFYLQQNAIKTRLL